MKIQQIKQLNQLIHSNINLYLPKQIMTNLNFVKCLSNALIKDELRVKAIFQKDFKARAILEIIKDLDFNNNLKWLSYDDINYYSQPLVKSTYIIIREDKLKNKINVILELERKKI